MGHRGSQLRRILDRAWIIGEVDDVDDVRSTEGGVGVAVDPGHGQGLGLGECTVLSNMNNPAERRGVGAVLDLDAVPIGPAQINGESDHAEEHQQDERHQWQNHTVLVGRDCADPFVSETGETMSTRCARWRLPYHPSPTGL